MLPKPWYRKSKKAWYLQVSRHEQKRLGTTKSEADVAYRQWLIEQGGTLPAAQQKKYTIAELAQEFLTHSQKHNDPKTYQFYCYFIVPFVERYGGVVAKDFLPLTFTKWLDEHKGWKGARRNAIIAVKRLFNWAVDNKLLTESPLKGVKKPRKRRRQRILTPEERKLIFCSIRDTAFREFLCAMLDSGCRPSEVMRVTANHVSRDGSLWILDEHKTDDATDEPRIIYLTPALQALTQRLIERYPEGPLFRMSRGKKAAQDRGNRRVVGEKRPWTLNALRCRFKRLREKYPQLAGVTAYSLRHSFATQALANGLSGPVVAALLGHQSTTMLDEHYNHLGQQAEMLKEAAKLAAVEKE